MSDFLGNLAARSLGTARGIRARVLPIFAERDAPGMRDPETSFDLDYVARDTTQQRSPAPEIAQLDRFEALHHPSPEEPASQPHAQHPAPDSHDRAVRASPAHPARTPPNDSIPRPPQPAEGHRPFVEATLSPLEEAVLPTRHIAATPNPVEQPVPREQPQPKPHLTSSEPSRPRTSPPSTAAEMRDEARSLAPHAGMPVQAQSAALPDLTIQAATAIPAHTAHLHAPDLSPVFTQPESIAAAPRPGRPPAFNLDGGRRTRNLQGPRQLSRNAPAEPDIHITIGRVDVRANLASPAQEKRDRSTSSLQLADYLKRRDGSGAA